MIQLLRLQHVSWWVDIGEGRALGITTINAPAGATNALSYHVVSLVSQHTYISRSRRGSYNVFCQVYCNVRTHTRACIYNYCEINNFIALVIYTSLVSNPFPQFFNVENIRQTWPAYRLYYYYNKTMRSWLNYLDFSL